MLDCGLAYSTLPLVGTHYLSVLGTQQLSVLGTQHLSVLGTQHLSVLGTQHLSVLGTQHLSVLGTQHLSVLGDAAPAFGRDPHHCVKVTCKSVTLMAMGDIREALAIRRLTQAPLLGLLLEARQRVAGTNEVSIEGASAWGTLGVAELATLADLALGAAIRRRLGAATPLPTLTLTLELDRECHEPGALVTASCAQAGGPFTGALGELRTARGALGRCLATFAVTGEANAVPPLPWEGDGASFVAEPLSDAEMSDPEGAVAAALGAGGQGNLEARLMPVRWQRTEGVIHGALWAGLALLNRSGQVQGGVLLGVAAAAARAAASQSRRLLSTHVQFLRPTAAGRLDVEAEVTRVGRSTEFASVRLCQHEATVAVAAVTLGRRSSQR
ncbi:MAG: acyl-CoA thioesterase domain-containing protein [Mycobacteriales bacterium]